MSTAPDGLVSLAWPTRGGYGYRLETSPEDTKLGSKYPSGRTEELAITLGAFRNVRNEIDNKSLVVMIRNEIYFILNHPENRHLLGDLSVKGDVVMFEDAARAFLAWQARASGTEPNWREIAQSPVVDLGAFLHANPDMISNMFMYNGNLEDNLVEPDAKRPDGMTGMVKSPADVLRWTPTSEPPDSPSPLWYLLLVLVLALLSMVAIAVRIWRAKPWEK